MPNLQQIYCVEVPFKELSLSVHIDTAIQDYCDMHQWKPLKHPGRPGHWYEITWGAVDMIMIYCTKKDISK